MWLVNTLAYTVAHFLIMMKKKYNNDIQQLYKYNAIRACDTQAPAYFQLFLRVGAKQFSWKFRNFLWFSLQEKVQKYTRKPENKYNWLCSIRKVEKKLKSCQNIPQKTTSHMFSFLRTQCLTLIRLFVVTVKVNYFLTQEGMRQQKNIFVTQLVNKN